MYMKKIFKIKINNIIQQIGVFDSEDIESQEKALLEFFKNTEEARNTTFGEMNDEEIKISPIYQDFIEKLEIEEVENND